MTLSPTALKTAERAVTEARSKLVNGSGVTLPSDSLYATAAITAYLAQAEKEGWVMVPKETLYEIANRASNMGDVDAADWLPSIYRIACEAVGEDPWPTLQRSGFDRAMIAAAQNGGEDAPPAGEK